jgi:SAM-dependent methyltransferase
MTQLLSNQTSGWSQAPVIQYYTDHRSSYDDLYDSERHFLTESFLSNIQSVIDVGCAAGGFFDIFRGFNPGIQYIGIDVSSQMLEVARTRFSNSTAQFLQYDGESALPASGPCDLAFCSGLLHLIPHWQKLAAQLVAISKGYVLVDFRVTPGATRVGKLWLEENSRREGGALTYHVINAAMLRNFIRRLAPQAHIECYGYPGKPNPNTEGVGEVYMAFFKISFGNALKNVPKWENQSDHMEKLFPLE